MNMSDVSCNDEGMYQCGIFLSADRSEFDVAPLNITRMYWKLLSL